MVACLGWVNSHHPAILSGEHPPLKCDQLVRAFSARLSYYRKHLPSWKRCTTDSAQDFAPAGEQGDEADVPVEEEEETADNAGESNMLLESDSGEKNRC